MVRRTAMPRAIATTRMLAPRHLWWLGALHLLALMLASMGQAAMRSSCPLATSVAPFASTTNNRYAITVTDGGAGDLDGVADGACDVSLGVCLADAASCDGGGRADSAGVRVRGGDRTARAALEAQVRDTLTSIGADDSLDAGDEASRCSATRLRLAAKEDARLSFRFRVAIDRGNDRSRVRRARVSIACLPAGGGDDTARCESRGQCPPEMGAACGNGVVDGPEEQCDGPDAQACPAACTATCTCEAGVPPEGPTEPTGLPTCGDGARNQPSERCDGSDDATCPGACNADCTCAAAGQNGHAARATVEASSAPHAVSPAEAAVDGVIGGLPGNPGHEWIAGGEEDEAWLRLSWPEPITIDRVVLHDRPNGHDNVTAGLLVTDDGHTVEVPALPPDGAPLAVMIGPRTVASLTFVALQATGIPGLSEIQVADAAPASSAYFTYFISPAGNDSASGTTRSTPWRTFARAIPVLRPGDTLILQDGTYTRGTTGLPSIDCTRNARVGAPYRPINIRAANERRAHLQSDGMTDAFYMNECSHWNVFGLRGSSADNSSANHWEANVFRVTNSSFVNLRRLLAVHPNRRCSGSTLEYCNSHAIAIEHSHHLLVGEAEVYDFHRHGVSVFASRWVTVRRSYMNPWGATGGAGGGSTGVILYGSSDSIVENVIGEGVYGINIAGGTTYDGTPGGYRNRVLGVVTLDARYGSTVRARSFGGPVLPVGHNLIRDTVYARTENVGVYSRGATNTLLENVTIFGTEVDAGVAADEDLGEGAPCSANPERCSITARNVLSFNNAGRGMRVNTGVVSSWLLEYSNLHNNRGGNLPTSESSGDDSGNIRRVRSEAPAGMGLGAGQCLLWAPDGSNMKRVGRDGRDIGANLLYRYYAGVRTNVPLWNPSTGAFPCGAVVPGVNDQASRSCIGIHQRLNVNSNGCSFPASASFS
jgi:hypothetical protein